VKERIESNNPKDQHLTPRPVCGSIEVIGGGDLVPGPDEPDGNRKGGLCPERLGSLEEPAAVETEEE